jgi:hypothetical protein
MMDEQLRPISSHAPEPIIVEIEGIGELEFPGDTDPSVIQAKVKELTTPKDYSQYGPMSQLYRDMDEREQNKQWVSDNAPVIGASAAGLATGGAGLIPSAIAAAGGGFLGARLRGDDRTKATTEGAVQGGIQAAGGGFAKLLGAVARPIYRAAIPKAVQDKFTTADLAGAGLENRVWLGTKQARPAAERAGARASQEVQAAAPSVPPLTAKDIQAAFAGKRARAVAGRKPQRVSEIDAHVQEAMAQMGDTPLDGAGQLARKEILEGEGKAAMQSANANLTAVNPQLANIERKAVASNLR